MTAISGGLSKPTFQRLTSSSLAGFWYT